MGKQTEITRDTFSSILKNVLRMDKSVASTLQRLIVFGFTEYDENKNSNWLSDIIAADLKSVRMQAIQQYVEDHTDLVLTKKDNGTVVFKREAYDGYKFVMPTLPWYEYSQSGKITFVDPIAVIQGAIKRLEAAEDETKTKKQLKAGTKPIADNLLAYLRAAPGINTPANPS